MEEKDKMKLIEKIKNRSFENFIENYQRHLSYTKQEMFRKDPIRICLEITVDQAEKSEINLLKESIFNIFQISLQNDNDDFSVQIKDCSKMLQKTLLGDDSATSCHWKKFFIKGALFFSRRYSCNPKN